MTSRSTPSRINAESLTYIVLAAISAYMVVESFSLGVKTESSWVSAGTMPFVVGVLMFLASIGLLIGKLRNPEQPEETTSSPVAETDAANGVPTVAADAAEPDPVHARSIAPLHGTVPAAAEDEQPDFEVKSRTKHLILVAGALAAAIALTPILGLLVAFGLMVVFLASIVEGKPLLTSALIATAAMVVCYLIFRLFLSVPIPAGILGGLFS